MMPTQGLGLSAINETPRISGFYFRFDEAGAWKAAASYVDPFSFAIMEIKFSVAGSPDVVGVKVEKTGRHYPCTDIGGGVYYCKFLACDIPAGTFGGTGTKLICYAVEDEVGDLFDSTGMNTITHSKVEAVQLIHDILDNGWNAGNVAKPRLMMGGERDSGRIAKEDQIKIYRTPRPTIRTPRGTMNFEDREAWVQISIHTELSRARMDALVSEVTRVINEVMDNPGGGWEDLWLESCDARMESATHWWEVADVRLRKVYQAVDV